MTESKDAHGRRRSRGEHESIWIDSSPTTEYAPLDGGLRVDTAVIGGGIAGITTAAELKNAGHDVAVLEAERIVTGVTGHTTAKLTSLHGLRYQDLVSNFDTRRARRYGDANEAAIDYVEQTVAEHDIDCDFERTPAFTYVTSRGERERVEAEVAVARQLGLPASLDESPPLPYDVEAAIRFDEQAKFHPRTYLLALAERIPGDGSYLFEETRALDIDRGAPHEVETERGTVRAEHVVVATHFPMYDHGLYFARMTPTRGYVLAARLEDDAPEGLYYRPGDPYFSVRPHPTGDRSLVLVGGQNHRTGHAENEFDRYRNLEREARSRFDVQSIEYRWSTQDYRSVDGVPFVGRLAPHTNGVYVATGFGGWGLTNGTAAGLLLADLICGTDNEWQTLYSPTRFTPRASAKELIEHNAHSVKHLVQNRLTDSSSDVLDLSPDEGEVVHHGSSATGVYRDEAGELHAVSAVCPHMGCILRWNDTDPGWDCPCHGSRFAVDGRVIDGPAVEDLPRRDIEE